MVVVSCVSHMLVSVLVTFSWSFRSLINLDLKLVTSNYNVIFLRSLKQESCRWLYEMYQHIWIQCYPGGCFFTYSTFLDLGPLEVE